MELVLLLLQSFDPQNRYLRVCFIFHISLVWKRIFFICEEFAIYMYCKGNGFFALHSILVRNSIFVFS